VLFPAAAGPSMAILIFFIQRFHPILSCCIYPFFGQIKGYTLFIVYHKMVNPPIHEMQVLSGKPLFTEQKLLLEAKTQDILPLFRACIFKLERGPCFSAGFKQPNDGKMQL